MKEAFVYLWYDSLNKKYYLGSSIGKDPNYAHSSSVMESFTMSTKPAYMHRKILDEGTHEEMCDLEIKLLKNRKERCWDRYYNVKWHTKAIGNLNDVLSEAGIKLWKERLSLAHKGTSKPTTSAGLKKFHESITDEQRKELYGRPLETNSNWKGGIALPENIEQYHKDKYERYLELGMRLHNEGYSYDEIRSMCPKAKLPYHLQSREEKDRRNTLSRDRYEHKRECYCRKSSCEYCNNFLLTPEELKQRQAERDAEKYKEIRNDPIRLEKERKRAKAWEEKNKEKRQRQQKERNAKRPKKGPADVSGKKNPFYGKTHTPETRKKISDARKKRHVREKAETQGVGTLDAFLK